MFTFRHIHVGLKRSNCALINGLVEWGAQMVVDLLFEIHSYAASLVSCNNKVAILEM